MSRGTFCWSYKWTTLSPIRSGVDKETLAPMTIQRSTNGPDWSSTGPPPTGPPRNDVYPRKRVQTPAVGGIFINPYPAMCTPLFKHRLYRSAWNLVGRLPVVLE